MSTTNDLFEHTEAKDNDCVNEEDVKKKEKESGSDEKTVQNDDLYACNIW